MGRATSRAVTAYLRAALLPMVIALVVGVAATWPLAMSPWSTLSWSPFAEGHAAALGFAARTPPWNTHLELAGWPSGVDFRPLLWPASLLAVATGSLLAYAILLVAIPALNVLGGVCLGAALRMPPAAAAILGALLAFPPWVRTTLQNGQPEQAWLGMGAAVVAAAIACAERRGSAWAAVPIVVFAGGVATPHVVIASMLLLGSWSLWGARASPPRLLVVPLAALGAAGVVAWHGAGLVDDSLFAPLGTLDDHAGPVLKQSAVAFDLFLPARPPPGKGPWVVHLAYVGLPLLLGAVAGRKATPWALAAAAVALVLALGDHGPMRWLGGALHPSAVPYRFTMAVVMGLAVAAASTRWGPWLAILSLLEAAVIDPRPLPFETALVRLDPSAEVIGDGQGAVLDLPVASTTCRKLAGHYLVEAGRHGRPVPLVLRSGFEAYGEEAPRMAAIDAALLSPDCAERLPGLLGNYTTVVAHRHAYCLFRESQLNCLRKVLGPGEESGEVYWWGRPLTP